MGICRERGEPCDAPERVAEPVVKWNVTSAHPLTAVVRR